MDKENHEETRFINFEKRALLNENLDDRLLIKYALVFNTIFDMEEFINRYQIATRYVKNHYK
jgi:hypothetical protein